MATILKPGEGTLGDKLPVGAPELLEVQVRDRDGRKWPGVILHLTSSDVLIQHEPPALRGQYEMPWSHTKRSTWFLRKKDENGGFQTDVHGLSFLWI